MFLLTITCLYLYMIFWEQYKQLKKIAEKAIALGVSEDFEVIIAVREFQTGVSTKEKCIEDIINILSGGEHYKP
jgi:hypothetical protein